MRHQIIGHLGWLAISCVLVNHFLKYGSKLRQSPARIITNPLTGTHLCLVSRSFNIIMVQISQENAWQPSFPLSYHFKLCAILFPSDTRATTACRNTQAKKDSCFRRLGQQLGKHTNLCWLAFSNKDINSPSVFIGFWKTDYLMSWEMWNFQHVTNVRQGSTIWVQDGIQTNDCPIYNHQVPQTQSYRETLGLLGHLLTGFVYDLHLTYWEWTEFKVTCVIWIS